jgi:hypothetical protein
MLLEDRELKVLVIKINPLHLVLLQDLLLVLLLNLHLRQIKLKLKKKQKKLKL